MLDVSSCLDMFAGGRAATIILGGFFPRARETVYTESLKCHPPRTKFQLLSALFPLTAMTHLPLMSNTSVAVILTTATTHRSYYRLHWKNKQLFTRV